VVLGPDPHQAARLLDEVPLVLLGLLRSGSTVLYGLILATMLREVPVPVPGRLLLAKLLFKVVYWCFCLRLRRFRDEHTELRVSLGAAGDVRSFELFYDHLRARLLAEGTPWEFVKDWPLDERGVFPSPPVSWNQMYGFGVWRWMPKSTRDLAAATFAAASEGIAGDPAIAFVAERLRELTLEPQPQGPIGLHETKRRHLLITMQQAHGNHTEAAKLLGISVSSLHGLLKAHSLETESSEAGCRRVRAALITWITIIVTFIVLSVLALAWLGK
jgi:regulatory Fis family protein